jgi:hypothetical protein
MSWFLFWKFLHIAFMFGVVAIFVGGGVVNGLVQRGRDVRAIRAVAHVEKRLQPVAGPMFLLGLVSGFLAGWAGGFDLLRPWLLISYGLVIAIFLVAVFYHAPQERKLEAAIANSSDDVPSADLVTLTRATPRTRLMNVVDSLLWLGIILAMVVKPFGI